MEVWNRLSISKHRFILWLSVLDRLQVKERLHRFKIAHDDQCVVCGMSKETRDHLFFDCHLSNLSFLRIKEWLDWKVSTTTIPKLLRWIARAKLSPFRKQVLAAALAATVYQIWHCRNVAIWNQRVSTVLVLTKRIQSVVKNRIQGVMPKKVNLIDRDWFENL
ncbi:uncharacterized protein LOC133814450 [Humulus lupulus]|uniref:uncharacterized protein LOC133814450 n=1 Tax=Humulus lupulus TaxID=3486 RepID=UPI002B40B030|nr:uncharacterized protein LOC133814450 [Humulus lupulus]